MYLDPGFGSMVIQLVIASVAAAVAMLGIFRAKIAAFFKKDKNTPPPGEEENEE